MGSVVHVRAADYDVYIGRGRCPRTGHPGQWGNPFRMGSEDQRSFVIAQYRRWLWRQVEAGEVTLEALASLADKRLGCWCAPRACHGDVLVRAADWAAAQLTKSR